MRQGLLTLALVGALCLGLTSCGMGNNQPDPNAGNNNSAANGGSDTAGSNSVTGGGAGDNAGPASGSTAGDSALPGGGNGSSANDTGSGGNGNGMTNNGDVGDINNDAIGNGDAGTNDNSNTQAQTRRASDLHRSAYDYLNDGRYRTSQTGNVIPRQGSMGIDMTQSVRDLIDDAKQLSREMMQTGGNITQRTGNAVRDAVD